MKGEMKMNVWLYYRLSRDDDIELNSLTNQREILVDYANRQNHTIVGESFDDNVSGMIFDRDGIDQLYEQVENKTIEMVLVKDLSRLGRHKIQTAICIDYLRKNNVRVYSVTENIDTFNEEDELIIGFKGLINDLYPRDISKKVRAGYRQKQKKGIVNVPPLGYFKDRNTNELIIVEEEAEIIRRIFSLYLDGYGLKAIAKKLNEQGIKSPMYYQTKMFKKALPYNKPDLTEQYLWNYTSVKRILTNELYIGTLVCHKTDTNKINHTRKTVPIEEQFRHEDYAPAIISKEKWNQVQFLLSSKKKNNVRASTGKPCHRYTGLLKCANCGSTFVCKMRKWRDKPNRIEYNCNGYHRYGRDVCSPHRINETDLDQLIYKELLSLRSQMLINYESIEKDIKSWISQKTTVDKKLNRLTVMLENKRSDQKGILLERIHDKAHAEIYDEMLEKCEYDIKKISAEIISIKEYNDTIKKRRSEMKESIDLIEQIIEEGAISDANLRMLVNEIIIKEKDNKLKIKIKLNAQFTRHQNIYDENGNLKECIFS
jgi:DNA invertase Pin-like site-specific DNA recombinase